MSTGHVLMAECSRTERLVDAATWDRDPYSDHPSFNIEPSGVGPSDA